MRSATNPSTRGEPHEHPKRRNADGADNRITPGRRGSSKWGPGPQDSLDHNSAVNFQGRLSEHHLDLMLATVVGQRDERFSREQGSVKADPGYPAADSLRV